MLAGFSQVRYDSQFSYRIGGNFLSYMNDETELHTPLYASAWAVKAGENSFIWVSCDITEIDECDSDIVRDQVEKLTGVERAHVLVSATHAHTGPTARAGISPFFPAGDLSYFEKIRDRLVQACVEAWKNVQEVTLSYARCDEPTCTHNRRYLMDNGESKMHPGGPGYPGRLMKEGPEDTELQAVWFMRDDQPAGILINYSAHPSVLYGHKVTSADYPGVMRRNLQAVYGADVPVIFLQGWCGNLAPCDHEHDATWGVGMDGAERVGTVLAADVMRMMAVTRESKDVSDIRIRTSSARLNLRKVTKADMEESNRVFDLLENDRAAFDQLDVSTKGNANKVRKRLMKWEKAPYEDVSISAVRLDDILLLTHPAELFCEYQLDIKKQLGAKTVCVELTNGCIGYVPTHQGYILKGYESLQGFYDEHAGQKIEDSLIELAHEMGR